MKIKLILKLILFVSGLLLINDRLSVILSPKSFPPKVPNVNSLVDKNWLATMRGGFYNEKPNTIDIVFIGSSKIFCNLNPNIIWNQYGITSYDFSGHMQDLGTSYYFLQREKLISKTLFINYLFLCLILMFIILFPFVHYLTKCFGIYAVLFPFLILITPRLYFSSE